MSRYVPEKFTGVDQAAAKVEREIREFVRRDAGFSRPQRTEEWMRAVFSASKT